MHQPITSGSGKKLRSLRFHRWPHNVEPHIGCKQRVVVSIESTSTTTLTRNNSSIETRFKRKRAQDTSTCRLAHHTINANGRTRRAELFSISITFRWKPHPKKTVNGVTNSGIAHSVVDIFMLQIKSNEIGDIASTVRIAMTSAHWNPSGIKRHFLVFAWWR